MKRNRWKKVPHPGWVGEFAKQAGYVKEVRIPEALLVYKFNNVVLTSDPTVTGMCIGHWLIGHTALTGALVKQKRVHICVSKCGVVAGYEPWEIAAGRLPDTCFACRAGEHCPPISRVLQESQIAKLQRHWEPDIMATAFEEQSRLNNDDGFKIWAQCGRPVVAEVVGRTRFGPHFGWKTTVCGMIDRRAAVPVRHRVKLNAVYKGERSFDLTVQHAEMPMAFNIRLATGRTDVPFGQIISEVERAVGILQSVDTGENVKKTEPELVVSTPSEPHPNGHIGPIDIAKLLKLQKGIETLMTVGKDVNELAGLKDAARSKVESLNATKGDLRVRLVGAEEAVKAAKVKHAACCERVEQLEMQLRNAIAARDNTHAELTTTTAKADKAAEEYGPADAAAAAAEKELAELDALEASRLKEVGDAKGMAALLEALSKIGG